MTTDWSQDSCGAIGEKRSKVLCTQFIQKETGGNLLFIVLRNFIKNVIAIQSTNNFKSARSVKGHRGKQEVTVQREERNCARVPH